MPCARNALDVKTALDVITAQNVITALEVITALNVITAQDVISALHIVSALCVVSAQGTHFISAKRVPLQRSISDRLLAWYLAESWKSLQNSVQRCSEHRAFLFSVLMRTGTILMGK